jgi:hypothetical protein
MAIAHKRTVKVDFALAGGTTQNVTIPGAENYTKFAITVPDVANNCDFSLTGCVEGAVDDLGAAVPNTVPLIHQGIHTTEDEVLFEMENGATNVLDIICPLNGGVGILVANGAAGAQSGTISIFMTGSPYVSAARL